MLERAALARPRRATFASAFGGRELSRWFSLAAVCALLVALPLITRNDYYLRLANWAMVAAMLAFSLNLIYGYTGQISLGHVGFYGIGAYTAAIFMVKLGLSFWLALPAAIALCMVIGLLIGVPTLRLRNYYLAIATLAFGIIVRVVLNRWIPVTEGPSGILGIPRPNVLGMPLATDTAFFYFLLLVLAGFIYIFHRLIDSPFGRALKSIRGNDIAAESLGIDTTRHKVAAFMLSAGMAGAAGALFATLNGFVGPSSFTEEHSITLVALLILCGLGTYIGPVIAGLFLVIVPELMRDFGSYQQWLYSILLVLVIFKMPMGIGGFLQSRLCRRAVIRDDPALGPEAEIPRFAAHEPSGVELCLTGVSRNFGGLAAVSNIDLRVGSGELIGLIGPNGAGKSTVINLMAGALRPSSGTITLGGTPLTGNMSAVARRGLVRTFQTPRLFESMTLLENVLVGVDRSAGGRFPITSRAEEKRRRRLALRFLEDVGLGADRHKTAGSVPFGQRRLLEVARALACRPRILMLDEPAAGLHSMEISTLEHELKRIGASGVTVMLVEHNVGLVMRTCTRVVVMKEGCKLAEGTPQDIGANREVIEAYLGESK
jgi:branched-chain amino acid transport system permease protein